MFRSLLTMIEIAAGVLGLWSLRQIREKYGNAAAGATGAVSSLLLVDSLLRTVRDSRYAQAWSMLVISATCLLIFSILFPPVSSFFAEHPNLEWATPVLLAIGLAFSVPWKFWGYAVWAAIPILWVQEVATDSNIRRLTSEPQRIAVQEPYNGGACGRTPNGQVKCCNGKNLQLYIQYEGLLSPYLVTSIHYQEVCI
jgi:MFS family permease